MSARIIEGDALARLAELPAESVHCVVTSPPYYGLRDYGVAGQLGLEATPDEYIARMVAVFHEVRRVLRRDGTAWVNMGDGYNAHPGQRKTTDKIGPKQETNGGSNTIGSRCVETCKPKDLLGIPWMLAFALRADGWWLRQDIIWAKPNPMPESVTDRCTKAHEYLFLLSKSERYFYDAEAIAEAQISAGPRRDNGAGDRFVDLGMYGGRAGNPGDGSRNRRSVWTIATEAFPESHFATFPTALVEPCILAGTSQKGVCPSCGAPWRRMAERERRPNWQGNGQKHDGTYYRPNIGGGVGNDRREVVWRGWSPTCRCDAGEPVPATVLDPFLGAGTTALVADRLGRNSIGIELNPAYAEMARRRIADDAGMFARLYDPEADAIASYNEAVREVGKRVKSGEPIPDFFLSDRAAE